MDRSGLVGDDGPTHHGAFDISYLTLMPNLHLIAPRDTTELREMVKFATGFDQGPLAVRYPRGAGDDRLPEQRTPIQFGKSETLRSGDAATIVAVGSMVSPAWEAAEKLAAEGTETTVINARWLKPIDVDAVEASVRHTRRLLTVEENVRIGGYGEQLRDALVERGIGEFRHIVMALPDAFIEHGSQPIIRAEAGLSADAIVETVRSLVQSHRAI